MQKLLIVALGALASTSALHCMDNLWVGFEAKLYINGALRERSTLVNVAVGSSLLQAINQFLKTLPGQTDKNALVLSIGNVKAALADLTQHGETLQNGNDSEAGALHIMPASRLAATYGAQVIDLSIHPIMCNHKDDLH